MDILNQNLYNQIYFYNYLIMVFSLPIIIAFKNKKKTKGFLFKFIEFLFDISIFIYFISIFFLNYDGFKELGIIVGFDIGIVVSIAIISFILNRNIILTIIVISGIGVAGFYYYYDIINERLNVTNILLSENGELLLDIKSHKMRKKIDKVLNKYEIKIRLAFRDLNHKNYSDLDDYYVLDIPKKYLDKIDIIRSELKETGAVDYIEENEVISIKPRKGKSQNLKDLEEYRMNDKQLNKLWAFHILEIDKVYNLIQKNNIKPKKQAVIAILDTGVDASHEDLKGNYRSINREYDRDTDKHGTHCAGIAGAVTNNNIGVASIFPSNEFIDITSITVLPKGSGTQERIIKGIIEASDSGVDVISMSLGGPSNPTKLRAYEEAIEYANKSGVIVVVAAGNESQNAKRYSPANVKGVITVSAIDDKLNMASFSNSIEDLEMGIAAPGVNIYSTTPNNDYESFNGTSMATPYVASLLGFMKSLRPNLTTQEAYNILVKTGRNTKNTKKTGVLIQPYRVIKYMLKSYK